MERLRKTIVEPTHTIKQALKQMDAMGKKTLLVVDSHNTLLGTVTDGDIRRWILKGRGLTSSIVYAMNANPVSLNLDYKQDDAKQIMIRLGLECLPVVDGQKKVVSAVWWVDFFEKGTKKSTKTLGVPVVIMAGGEGTRLEPFTKILPKPLMPIGEKPVVEIIMDRFLEWGCHDFYLSVNYKSNIIKAYFKDFEHPYKIAYIDEKKPLGTAGSLHFLKKRIQGTLFLSNCDILIDADYADILKFHQENRNTITLVSSMKHFTIPYGVCEIGGKGTLKNIKEKPEYDFLVNTGMYVLGKQVLKDIPANRVYHMTDLINDYLHKGKRIGVYPVSEKSWLDMGQFEALQEMLKKFEIKS
ncbi:MAG: nucleotidyltransferase family protein [Candidatus Omnitrophica bacterium]|nr:nucleotidyltransferase family protein [Candidatus Omnitrophota bacterium]MDE2223438.1 nucleotidyltransferase family protein [Candidatus Omnitrophota bacterium]